MPITDTATGGGDQTTALKVLIPFSPGFFRDGGKDWKDGLIPLSELAKNGVIEILLGAGELIADADDSWDVKDNQIDVRMSLITVELPFPVEHVHITEYVEITSLQSVNLIGDGVRRYLGLFVADDTDADLTQPTSFSLSCDGDVVLHSQAGNDHIDLANLMRKDNVNDLGPTVCPIVTANRSHNSALPVASGAAILQDAGAQHTGNYAVVQRVAQRPSRADQKRIFLQHGVPADMVDQYLSEMSGGGGELGKTVAYIDQTPSRAALAKRTERDIAGLAMSEIRP